MNGFSWSRFVAVLAKEFVQMRRDRLTFAMMVGVPIMQLVLFGFAINSDPKQLPTAVLAADPSVFSRSIVRAMENSGYFRVDSCRRQAKRPAGGCSRPARCSSWSRAGGLLAQAPARRTAGAAGRGGRLRSGGDVERADRARST